MEERLKLSFDALEDALKRIGTYDPGNRFAPLAESLLWIDLLNTAFYKDNKTTYLKKRQADNAGVTIEGLRYARNRLTHDPMVYGMHAAQLEGGAFSKGFSKGFDIGTHIWRWRNVNELPPWSKDKKLKPVYEKYLQDKEVEPTLHDAANFLRLYRTGWVPTQEEE